MGKRKTLKGGLSLLVGGILTSILAGGCVPARPISRIESNKIYAARAISKVDEFYSGEQAEKFKQSYRDIQEMSPEKFNELLAKYNSNEKWFLDQVGQSKEELRKKFPWHREKLSDADKVIIVKSVEGIWNSIEKATYNATIHN